MSTPKKTSGKPTPKVAVEAPELKQVEEIVAATQEKVEEVAAATQEQVEKTVDAAAAGYDEFTAIQKASVDALVQAGSVLARGAEDLGKEYFAFAQEAANANAEAAKALLAAKSIEEVVDLQGSYAQLALDKSLAESTKLSELSAKIGSEALQPIQAQFNAAIEKAIKPVAA